MKRSILIVCALGFAILLGTLVSRGDSPEKAAGGNKQNKADGNNKQPAVESSKKSLRETPVRRTGTEAIEAALEKRVPCEFVETPLKDVVEYLKDAAKIEIWIDEEGLREEGKKPDIAVTCNLRDCRLEDVLHILLRKHHLDFGIRNNVLWITSEGMAGGPVEIRTYDVADLVIYQEENGKPVDDYDPLIEVITNIVSPPTWDHNGGKGSVSGASLGTAKVLVVSQTREVHREIEELLTQIRTIAAKKSGGDALPRKAAASRSEDPKKKSPQATNQQS